MRCTVAVGPSSPRKYFHLVSIPGRLLWARKLNEIQKLKTDKAQAFQCFEAKTKGNSAACLERPGERLKMKKALPDSTRMAPGKLLNHPINDECIKKE